MQPTNAARAGLVSGRPSERQPRTAGCRRSFAADSPFVRRTHPRSYRTRSCMSDWTLSTTVLCLAVSACSSGAHVTSADDACVKGLVTGTDAAATVAFFTAPWSGPDQMLMPIFDKAMHERPDIAFRKVDVDADQTAATACDIRAVPTLVGVRRGRPVARLIGAVSKERLDLFLDLLSAPRPGSQ